MNVDGSVEWAPKLAGDEDVHRLFAAHQHRDKGFGAAMGCDAVGLTAGLLAAAGYEVHQAASDWRIDGREGAHAVAMLRAMVEGTGAAALQQEPSAGAWVRDWMAYRLGALEQTCLRVGHRDLLATLP
jgi:hypothetical protein